jgi:hypothetical protein
MQIQLLVDDDDVALNKFVVNLLSGTIVGAVTSLRGIKEDWKEIIIKVER